MPYARRLLTMLSLITAFATVGFSAMAMPHIQQLTTPKGISVWLVESHQNPLISVEVAFRAGSAFEPAASPGLANFTASLLDEGAGKLGSSAFKQALDEHAIRLGAGADTLDIAVTLDTLTPHANRAFELLGMALTQPRFDAEPVMRIKQAIVAGLKRAEENPSAVAQRALGPAIFGSHPYSRTVGGTLTSVPKLTAAQAKAYHAAQFNKANMVVSVVGDISAEALLPLVDAALGKLPERKLRNHMVEAPAVTQPKVTHTTKPVPQATILLGHLGVPRTSPDFWPMLVMNELLGGGVLTSRLFQSVREENGLAYDVRSMNLPLPGAGSYIFSVQSDNAKAQLALDLIAAEVRRIRTQPPSQEEFDDVVAYLTGSFPLRLDSNAKILSYLTLMQMENLGPDYLDQWLERVKAVRRDDLTRVAAANLHPEAMTLVVVGGEGSEKLRWHPDASPTLPKPKGLRPAPTPKHM